MISCRAVRRHMLEVARESATDAVRLQVEAHLGGCRACEAERARWRLVAMVKEQPAPRLGHAAERRVLDEMTVESRRSRLSVSAPVRRPARWLPVTLSAAALVVAALLFARFRLSRAPAVTEGEIVDAEAPGSVSFAGAEVRYEAGTYMTLHPGGRTLSMSRGALDVDVTPGLPGRFKVVTPRFVVEVLGTRFLVTLDSVRTLRGHVRVLDPAGGELATLVAGDGWTAVGESLTVPPPAPPAAKTTSRAPASRAAHASSAEARRRHAHRTVASLSSERHATESVAELLARSRAALAHGDAQQARALAQRALRAGPTEGELASTELLLADTLLVLRRRDEAIAAYRLVVRRSPRWPEAEMAEFTVGQLLYESGAPAQASSVFQEYLSRYPTGRFAREAREHLANIQHIDNATR